MTWVGLTPTRLQEQGAFEMLAESKEDRARHYAESSKKHMFWAGLNYY